MGQLAGPPSPSSFNAHDPLSQEDLDSPHVGKATITCEFAFKETFYRKLLIALELLAGPIAVLDGDPTAPKPPRLKETFYRKLLIALEPLDGDPTAPKPPRLKEQVDSLHHPLRQEGPDDPPLLSPGSYSPDSLSLDRLRTEALFRLVIDEGNKALYLERRLRRAFKLMLSAVQEDTFLVPVDEGADDALEASGTTAHLED